MRKPPICTIVNFCSNESRFIQPCLEQAMLFSRQVIVPVCDHFFDGSPENRPLLQEIYEAFPDCLFVEYPFKPQKIPKKIWKKVDPAHFWMSLSRLIATQFVDEEIETLLFLDADEITDGARFAEWLENSDYQQHMVLKLANYWYFREPCYQALHFEDSIVLVQKRALDREILLHQDERDAIYNLLPGPKRRQVMGVDGVPMFHHYSWVRTQEEMLKKARAWGHKNDRDWVALVNAEFTGPFRGTDFVHGYHYQTVKPFFEIPLQERTQFKRKGAANVKKLDIEEVLPLIKSKGIWNLLDF